MIYDYNNYILFFKSVGEAKLKFLNFLLLITVFFF